MRYILGNRFDLIVVRDALQHMHVRNGLQAVYNAVMSGAKYFALTSYPPNNQPSTETRALEKNESLPSEPLFCNKQDYCLTGLLKDGGFYQNNINCPPFNFPLNKSLLVQPSHQQFKMENDEIHVYKIDDGLKQIVQHYHKACP